MGPTRKRCVMSRKPDEKPNENSRPDGEATGTVFRLIPRAEREEQANLTAHEHASDSAQDPAWDDDDDDPGPRAA
jgi:hypothetical protein